ncbi:MAG: hypothetical protein KGL18_10795 [Burkholderiales bacterium]|nr:hypothetical protein [Burkholderiales bacterium]MDE1926566.1 hypothetical protein [Burkholderiales bacterium]MDE2503442.1 hypothetical protein [Burkholderiales bacterium]
MDRVDAERRLRASDRGLAYAMDSIKRFQQQRLAPTYADLQRQDRDKAAVRFFLDELYGPGDVSRRDIGSHSSFLDSRSFSRRKSC